MEPGRPEGSNDVRSPASRRLLIGDPTDAELREFYLDSYIDDWFLRLGKQQIVWGEADGLRVLDLINPLHFREFILSDFEDRRIPLWIAQAEVPIGDVLAQFVWVPDHTFDDVPAAGATFAVSSPRFVPGLTPALVGAGPVVLANPNRPDDLFVDDDYGVRVTAFTIGWDFSFNYLFSIIRTRRFSFVTHSRAAASVFARSTSAHTSSAAPFPTLSASSPCSVRPPIRPTDSS